MIYFLTGASGVGKTTLAHILKEQYKQNKNYGFFHFDSIDVPSIETMNSKFGGPEQWQKAKTHEWVTKLCQEHFEHIFMEGQCNLSFIEEAFKDNNTTKYQIILIDCNDEDMKKRLAKRGQAELFTQDMKNWRQYLRNQAQAMNIKILNTSNTSIAESAKALQSLLQ